eukprot:gene24632-29763_t
MNNFEAYADSSHPSPSFAQPYGNDYFPMDPKGALMEFMPQESPRYLLEIHVSFITYRMDMQVNKHYLMNILSRFGRIQDFTMKKFNINVKTTSQSGYGFAAYDTVVDALTTLRHLKGATVDEISYDCHLSHRSLEKLSVDERLNMEQMMSSMGLGRMHLQQGPPPNSQLPSPAAMGMSRVPIPQQQPPRNSNPYQQQGYGGGMSPHLSGAYNAPPSFSATQPSYPSQYPSIHSHQLHPSYPGVSNYAPQSHSLDQLRPPSLSGSLPPPLIHNAHSLPPKTSMTSNTSPKSLSSHSSLYGSMSAHSSSLSETSLNPQNSLPVPLPNNHNVSDLFNPAAPYPPTTYLSSQPRPAAPISLRSNVAEFF